MSKGSLTMKVTRCCHNTSTLVKGWACAKHWETSGKGIYAWSDVQFALGVTYKAFIHLDKHNFAGPGTQCFSFICLQATARPTHPWHITE